MGLRIEIDTDRMALPEWRALAAFVAVMTEPEACEVASSSLPYRGESHGRIEFAALPENLPKLAPADNPETGLDPELASFGVGNAPGGTATAAPFAAVPAAGAVPSLPPATPPAPPVTATAASGPASPVPLDKRGLPWDHRIHSSSKDTIADGTWKKKRNVAEELLATVEAELCAVMAIPSVVATVPLPPPARSGPSSLPPPPPGDTAMTFVKLMPKVTAAIAAGTITLDRVNAVLKHFGFPHLPALATKPDWVPTVHDAIFNGGA